MSENDIKPVAWMTLDGFEVAHPSDATEEYSEPLYDQSAIDRLTAERDDYAKAADFLELEMAKFQIAADEAKAERDAAVAALDRIVSLKMSMFKDPYDMIGECVKIAAEAIEAAMAEAK